METGLDRGMVSILLADLMLLCLFFLSAISFPGIPACPGIHRVPLFSLMSVGLLWCGSVFVLFGWSEFAFEALVGNFLSL